MKKSQSEGNEFIKEYFDKQEKFKVIQAKFEDAKKNFYQNMNKIFEKLNDATKDFTFNTYGEMETYKVSKVQKVKVLFDVSALEKALGNLSSQVIRKEYKIVDMFGLSKYLRECKVDPKIFKSFISVNKSVDEDELDKLEELGKITKEQIEGCYSIQVQTPYFTVKKRGKDGEKGR